MKETVRAPVNGKWLSEKSDISLHDINQLVTNFYKKKLIPLFVNRHPKEIIDFAKKNNWNQI
jgi:hypothetical protein